MWVSSPDTTPGDLPNNSGIFDPAANSAADCCTTERCPGQDLVWMPRDKCDCMTFVWCCPLRPVSARNVTLWSPLSRGSQAQGRSARRAGSRPELHAVAQLAAAQLDANLLGGRASRAQTELLHKAASVNRSIRNSGNNKPQQGILKTLLTSVSRESLSTSKSTIQKKLHSNPCGRVRSSRGARYIVPLCSIFSDYKPYKY